MSNGHPMRRPRPGPGVKAPVPAQNKPAPSQNQLAPAHGYVAVLEAPESAIDPMSFDFIDALSAIQAKPVNEPEKKLRAEQSLASARGYAHGDLMAIAEVGYHYLCTGYPKLALALFEGLHAVEPREPYFALALGLLHDQLGDVSGADLWYRKASELDPSDGRAEVNRAELYLERDDLKSAHALLLRGVAKAERRRDLELTEKARSMLQQIERLAAARRSAQRSV